MIEISLASLVCGIIAVLFSGFSLGMSVSNLLNCKSKNNAKNTDDYPNRGNDSRN